MYNLIHCNVYIYISIYIYICIQMHVLNRIQKEIANKGQILPLSELNRRSTAPLINIAPILLTNILWIEPVFIICYTNQTTLNQKVTSSVDQSENWILPYEFILPYESAKIVDYVADFCLNCQKIEIVFCFWMDGRSFCRPKRF